MQKNSDTSTQPTTVGSNFIINWIVEFVASTSLGLYLNKKIDLMLWTFEKTAKYSVQENSKVDEKENVFVKIPMERPLPWLVFWIVLINLHLFRIVFSKILVNFDKNAIESRDMVRTLQKWRRTLRSIRFNGHKKARQQRYGNTPTNGNSFSDSDPSRKPPSKKRHYDEVDFDVLDELLNRTFESDEMDSTYMAGTSDENSTTTTTSSSYSSYEDSHLDGRQPSLKLENNTKLPATLEDTLPMGSSRESESAHSDPNASIKSDEVTFESTVDNTDDMDSTFRKDEDEVASTSTFNEEHYSLSDTLPMQDTLSSFKSIDSIESTEPDSQPESSNSGNVGKGKEALNQFSDPTDALIFKLVNIQKSGKPNNSRMFGKPQQQGHKKNAKSYNDVRRHNSVKSSQENLNRQQPIKKSKSQELLCSEKID